MSCLIIATGNKVKRTPDLKIWTCGSYNTDFFQRYLEVFDSVKLIARVEDVKTVPEDFSRVDSDKIEVVVLQNFTGLTGALKNIFSLNKVFWNLVKEPQNQFLLRVPGLIQTLFWIHCLIKNKEYGLEVIVDPALDFDPKSYGSNFGYIFKYLVACILKIQCRKAYVTSYVTSHTMQKSYPPGNKNTFSFSSLDIGEEAFQFANKLKENIENQPEVLKKATFSFTGDLSRPYKGLDLLIKSMSFLQQKGYEVTLIVIGGGTMKEFYIDMINKLNLSGQVEFVGLICDPKKIYHLLSTSDIFVLPSRREGLPRAIIEAMAVGLPCVSTNIAGIPEIMEERFMVDMEDQKSLNEKIEVLLNNKKIRLEASLRNSEVAKKYDRIKLTNLRKEFYLYLNTANEDFRIG